MKVDGQLSKSWTAEIVESSAGVYQLSAKHESGSEISLTGTDPDAMLMEAKTAADNIEKEIAGRSRS